MMKLTFSNEAWSDYLYWQSQDKKTLKRVNQLLQSIARDGTMQGIGKPEPLKHDKQGLYSRRIDDFNRLVYSVREQQIEIIKCKGHYED